MPNQLNGKSAAEYITTEHLEKQFLAPTVETPNVANENPHSRQEWSYATQELLDALPKVWTRGLFYFLIIFISIILPWAMLSKVDETGTALGRLEPNSKTTKLDAPVAGTVEVIKVKEGETVKAGQTLMQLESKLVSADLQLQKIKLSEQQSRLTQLELSKNQLSFSLRIQEQENEAQELEKKVQVAQEYQTLSALQKTYSLQKEEKLAQVNQARQDLEHYQTAYKLAEISLANAQREWQRYYDAWQEGIVSEIQVVEKEDIIQERTKLLEQAQADIKQAELRLAEQQSSYERTIKQAESDIEQAELRLAEQQSSYQSLIHSGKRAILSSKENIQSIATQITTLKSEITQTQSQIKSLEFQLNQRVIKAPISGIIYQLPIQKAGAVVQSGTRIIEIAPEGSSLIVRAQMGTSDSGFLTIGMPVKLKFDAYPFQDYGILEGKLLKISPTTEEVDTPSGKVAAYILEIKLEQDCIPTDNECIELRPGDTVTAEIVVRQRRIIDYIIDPFKKLQKGDFKL